MKTLALLLATVLQVTGLWPHLPAPARQTIATTAVGQPPADTPIARPHFQALPIRIHNGAEPAITKNASVLVLDRATATPLYHQNEAKIRPIASITKLVTALVILARHNPAERTTIPTLPTYGPEDERLGLATGETYTWGDLVRAALIPSANDAADALALIDSGSQTKFAAQMNLKLREWGIEGARFSNPSGLQDTGNAASTQALAQITLLALEQPFIRTAVAEPSLQLISGAGRTITANSTNKLLATGKFHGIKTGYTLAAGQCFIGLTQVEGHDVITVVLGSDDRFGDTQTLVNWIGHNYQWL